MTKHLIPKRDRFQVSQFTRELIGQVETADKAVTYESAARLIEKLPLATEEFFLSQVRLKNAANYLAVREVAAARYEARLVVGVLKRFLKSWG